MHRIAALALPGVTVVASLTAFVIGRQTVPKTVMIREVTVERHVEPAPPPAKPPKFAQPIGGQFLSNAPWLDHGGDMPVIFLLSAKELDSHRYMRVMPRIANDLHDELRAVIAEAHCTDCQELSNALDQTNSDEIEWSPVTTRRWTDSDDIVTADHRSITLRSKGKVSLEAWCQLASWTVGMGMYNDVPQCKLTVRDGARVLAEYDPMQDYHSGKEGIYEKIDRWEQIVHLPKHDLDIETGYEYSEPDRDARVAKTDRVRPGVVSSEE
ncbi:MAG: hypothetical protein QM831_18350 [Kofleriaceae bacterium]